MNLGKRYKELRESIIVDGKPIGVNKFATEDYIKLPSSRISELENNKREMSLTELKVYHEYFKVSFEYLLGETDVKDLRDTDIAAMCEYTGLTKEIIEDMNLSICVEGGEYIKIRNQFLNSNIFDSLVSTFWCIEDFSKEYCEQNLKVKINSDGSITGGSEVLLLEQLYEKCDLYRYNVIKDIEKLSDIFDKRCSKATITPNHIHP